MVTLEVSVFNDCLHVLVWMLCHSLSGVFVRNLIPFYLSDPPFHGLIVSNDSTELQFKVFEKLCLLKLYWFLRTIY